MRVKESAIPLKYSLCSSRSWFSLSRTSTEGKNITKKEELEDEENRRLEGLGVKLNCFKGPKLAEDLLQNEAPFIDIKEIQKKKQKRTSA